MRTKISSLLILLLLCAVAWAQPQQSTDFRMTKSVIDAGGTLSTSTDFRLTSAFGQPSPLGMQSSTNFILSPGFLSPMFSVSPISPIQNLVIRFNRPDIRLDWGRIPGAHSYVVYRDTSTYFTPSASNQIGIAADSFYVDNTVSSLTYWHYYYIVEASSSSPSLTSTPKGLPPHENMSVTPGKQASHPADVSKSPGIRKH
jgi:hypothetical protein